tara:strand:+ start:140 stop:382 length:243 start_codon:yes stop_codon:yes gene_type:complete
LLGGHQIETAHDGNIGIDNGRQLAGKDRFFFHAGGLSESSSSDLKSKLSVFGLLPCSRSDDLMIEGWMDFVLQNIATPLS